ncbi:MAG: hypothetical protein BWK76_17015 [Desulfobulbaceae bacterium A2]|nr:MAG: hypothetical protein BWK76_17015 [Desulfobulbaceae bacterium A2]
MTEHCGVHAGEVHRHASALRVLMLVTNYPYPVVGGLERQAHELAKSLRAIGTRVQVISNSIAPRQTAQEAVEGIPVERIPWPKRRWARFPRAALDLSQRLYRRRREYDVLHIHQPGWFGLFSIMLARAYGKPVLTKLPGTIGMAGTTAHAWGRFKLRVLRCSDAIVVMSRESMDELLAIGFPACRILACPNGITCDDMSVSPQAGTQLCRVAFVGRLSQEKNVDVLLTAWKKVLTRVNCRCRLELWGSGPLESALRHQCSELGITDSVCFHGYVPGVREQLPGSDILVLPSRSEGNSNALLEAMAAGLPVVATRVGGTPMLMGSEWAGFLCEPGDAGALADRLLALIHDPELRERMGRALRRRVEQFFVMQHIAATYAAAYRFLATGQRDRISEASNSVVLDEAGCVA